jgi:hypothetical protein
MKTIKYYVAYIPAKLLVYLGRKMNKHNVFFLGLKIDKWGEVGIRKNIGNAFAEVMKDLREKATFVARPEAEIFIFKNSDGK